MGGPAHAGARCASSDRRSSSSAAGCPRPGRSAAGSPESLAHPPRTPHATAIASRPSSAQAADGGMMANLLPCGFSIAGAAGIPGRAPRSLRHTDAPDAGPVAAKRGQPRRACSLPTFAVRFPRVAPGSIAAHRAGLRTGTRSAAGHWSHSSRPKRGGAYPASATSCVLHHMSGRRTQGTAVLIETPWRRAADATPWSVKRHGDRASTASAQKMFLTRRLDTRSRRLRGVPCSARYGRHWTTACVSARRRVSQCSYRKLRPLG